MQTIWKFPLKYVDKQSVEMPVGAEIISAQDQNGEICLWAVVNPEAQKITRIFRIFGTGQQMPPVEFASYLFIGTVQDGSFVWHIFEIS